MPNFSEQLAVPCESAQLATIRAFVERLTAQRFSSREVVNKLVLAVDEAAANAIEHAGAAAHADDLIVEITADAETLKITLTYRGHSFDINTYPRVELKTHVSARLRNGLGIYIIRSVMDEIKYTFTATGFNVLQMIKYVNE
jgi:anti-sigma regulatory factor (Ser/Thr protein kinase)